ncbi:MAG: hypothetical protein M3N19_04835 [Candidatus Eremiobacteraeota bacterium]|nr:hypothetical protein [Candidatus Eremiobacteraeota bacterium]
MYNLNRIVLGAGALAALLCLVPAPVQALEISTRADCSARYTLFTSCGDAQNPFAERLHERITSGFESKIVCSHNAPVQIKFGSVMINVGGTAGIVAGVVFRKAHQRAMMLARECRAKAARPSQGP